jgi:hypothetical protein
MNDNSQYINFDREKLDRLKAEYEANKNKEVFFFEGNALLPDYAKYMIQYLESVLK